MRPSARLSSPKTAIVSLLALVATACGGGGGGGGGGGSAPIGDAATQVDAGGIDATVDDASSNDSGQTDAGEPDAGEPDANEPDGGEPDAGEPDAAQNDGGGNDAGTTSGWHHVFDMTGESTFTDAVELPSGDIVAVGAVSSFGAGAKDGFVARFTSAGAYVWSRALGTSYADEIHAVVGDGAGGVVLVGQTKDPWGVVPFVARVDATGKLVFGNNLNAPTAGLFWDSNLVLTDVVRLSDGNFALIGHHEADDKTTAAPGHFRGWVGVIDSSGSLVRQRRFGDSSAYLGFYEGTALPGGDIVVVGWWNKSGLVMRLDPLLEVKWRSTKGPALGDEAVNLYTVLPLPSGDLIVGGNYFTSDFTTVISHWYVQRLTANGTGVWSRRLEHDFSSLTGLYLRGTNELIALGQAPSASDADAYAAVVDLDGFLISQHSLGLPGTDWLIEGALTSNGSLIAAGYDGGTPHGSARIAKIPSQLPACDPTAKDRLASVSASPPGAPNTTDFGNDYGVTVSSSGPLLANGPQSKSPIAVCAP